MGIQLSFGKMCELGSKVLKLDSLAFLELHFKKMALCVRLVGGRMEIGSGT
jgi:hypothetical protein